MEGVAVACRCTDTTGSDFSVPLFLGGGFGYDDGATILADYSH
jgi:hypothetical protein